LLFKPALFTLLIFYGLRFGTHQTTAKLLSNRHVSRLGSTTDHRRIDCCFAKAISLGFGQERFSSSQVPRVGGTGEETDVANLILTSPKI
jgi:hypothetical protein